MIEKIKNWVQTILETEPTYFCVDMYIKPTQNIKIFLDGDNGITIEKCTQINRKLRNLIEESGILNDTDYSLEVSSPGLDNPLKLHRQYVKNIQRNIQITLLDDTIIEGVLKSVTENDILVETTINKGKKKEVQEKTVLFSNIKKTIVLIKF